MTEYKAPHFPALSSLDRLQNLTHALSEDPDFERWEDEWNETSGVSQSIFGGQQIGSVISAMRQLTESIFGGSPKESSQSGDTRKETPPATTESQASRDADTSRARETPKQSDVTASSEEELKPKRR